MSELGDRDRELVSLYYAGLNGGQIAELLDARRNTIDVALHRALARLRTIVERQRSRGRHCDVAPESGVRKPARAGTP